jgi:hypothetical protein
MCGSIAAHARCINAIDCNEQGLLASVSDDCFVRVWKLSGDAENLQVNIFFMLSKLIRSDEIFLFRFFMNVIIVLKIIN